MKAITDDMIPQNIIWDTITSKDLLYKFIELIDLCPDLLKWREPFLVTYKRDYILYKQLRVLFDVFNIVWNPDYFMSGMFINTSSPQYDSLFERIAPELRGYGRPNFRLRREQLTHCFRILLRYRLTLTNPLSFGSGVTAASGLMGYAHYKAYGMNQIIRERLLFIDNLLAEIINPEGKTFKLYCPTS